MALVPINEPVLAPSVNGYLVAVFGASVEVRAASSATLGAGALVPAWTAPDGVTRAEPLQSVNGRIAAFIEPQMVDLVIGAVTGLSLATIRRVVVGTAPETSKTTLTRNEDATIATVTDSHGHVTDQIVRDAQGTTTGFREDGITRSVVRVNGRIMEVT